MSWLDLIGASLGGGTVVKLFDYLYREHIRKSQEHKSARQLIDKNLDPILKASDELLGSIRSLAQSDFQFLIKAPRPKGNEFEKWFPYLDVMYLFAHLWSRIQILRLEGLFANLGADKRGKKLLAFFRALESRKAKIVGKAWQRGIGESLIKLVGNEFYSFTFAEFTKEFLSNNEFNRWFQGLVSILVNLNSSHERQLLLVYGTIIHALVDTLDEKHLITSKKPGWSNKLSQKSKRELKYRVFQVYLPFVDNYNRYITGDKN